MQARRRHFFCQLVVHFHQSAWTVFAEINVHSNKIVNAFFHRGRQIVVRMVHVYELCVAALARQRYDMQRSGFRRHRIIRMIGMKSFPGNVVLAWCNWLVIYLEYRGVRGNVAGFSMMRHDFTEHTAGLQKLLGNQFLPADRKHVIAREIGVELPARRIADGLRQINPLNFCARLMIG